MFTGIVEKTAPLLRTEKISEKSVILEVGTGYLDLSIGESVSVSGVCLTVTEVDSDGRAIFYVSPETLEKTKLGAVPAHGLLNMERALRLEDRLSGHLVQGHVDGMGQIEEILESQGSRLVRVSLPDELARYCIEKGSVTVDGISLTINRVLESSEGKPQIELMIIPHTWNVTSLRDTALGALVNIEVDPIAKYVEKLCIPFQKHSTR